MTPPAEEGNGKGVTPSPRARPGRMTRPERPAAIAAYLADEARRGKDRLEEFRDEPQEISEEAAMGKPDAVTPRLISLAAYAIVFSEVRA